MDHDDDDKDEDDDSDDEDEILSDSDVEDLLRKAIETFDEGRFNVRSFEEAGVLTMNKGLVLRIGDRSWQLSIVRSG